jgi:hypothetical protein
MTFTLCIGPVNQVEPARQLLFLFPDARSRRKRIHPGRPHCKSTAARRQGGEFTRRGGERRR